MKLLVFDTSTNEMGIAVRNGHKIFQMQEEGGARASETILPRISQLMQQAQLNITDLDTLAFGCGPGAFTGLRASCSVAQGLAMGAGLTVIPLITLLCGAEQYRLKQAQEVNAPFDIVVKLDARMNEWYWAHYRWNTQNEWETVIKPTLNTLDDLESYVQQTQPAHIVTINAPQLDGMLSLAQTAWHNQQALPPEQALPLYVRNKVALTTAERLALHLEKQLR